MADTEEKKVQEDEAEYESDSEAALLWAMRRKEASDEESEEEGKESRERFWRARIGGDDESDGLGGAMEYDDEESYIDELEVDDDLEEEMEEEVKREAQVSLGGGDEDRVSEVVLVKQESEEALRVPTAGKFYMHDDRFGAKRFGQRRYFNLYLEYMNLCVFMYVCLCYFHYLDLLLLLCLIHSF